MVKLETYIVELGWEWSSSDSGGVGLDDTNNLLDGQWVESQTSDAST